MTPPQDRNVVDLGVASNNPGLFVAWIDPLGSITLQVTRCSCLSTVPETSQARPPESST